MEKHLLQHYDVEAQQCLACDFSSEYHKKINERVGQKPDLSLMDALFKDIGKHLNDHHMVRADAEKFESVPKRQGFKISSKDLICMECKVMQDDVKSLQEHLKEWMKISLPFHVAYCRKIIL